MVDLKNQIAIITGAGRGIGFATAKILGLYGAIPIICDVLSESELANAINALQSNGISAYSYQVDVTQKDQIDDMVQNVMEKWGQIDILVNNAGVGMLDDAENLSEEIWDKTMAVNLKAPFMLSQIIGREMIKQKKGKIINIASQAGLIALDKHVAYCSSKAGIIGMTKVLALEWAEYGINVNAIAPTVILTELGIKAWSGEVGEAMKKKIPLRRFGYPEEVAAAALYLASEASNLVTGETLVIDGGYCIQ